MSRIIRVTIVLGSVLVALAVSVVAAAQAPSDAFERASPTQQAVLADSHERQVAPTVPPGAEARRVAESRVVAQSATPVPTDSHERVKPGQGTAGPVVVADTGWFVSLTDVLLVAAIGVGTVAIVVLLVGAIRRYPPRRYPPLAHH